MAALVRDLFRGDDLTRAAAGSPTVKKHLSRKFRPSVSGLEGRQMMTAGILPTRPGNTRPSVPVLPVLPAGSDTALTVTLVLDHRTSPATSSIVVDGSDYDDHVLVNNYAPGLSITVDLQQWAGGAEYNDHLYTLSLAGSRFKQYPAVQVSGRGGNDQITADVALSASIDGGAGNDQLKDGAGGGDLSGGDGNDTLLGGSSTDNLFGGEGDDYIRGGDGGDYIDGGHGNNILYGDGGNDQMIAIGRVGDHEQIHGGDGNDLITGSSGNDLIYGDGDNDTIYAGAGNDQVHGGDGNDTIYGDGIGDNATDGNDTINGDAGNDALHGGGGNDTLMGDDDDDSLYGDTGQDYLYGGNGNDRLDGGFYTDGGLFNNFNVPDVLYGGLGADTFVKHKSVLGSDDIDWFVDYNSAQHDSTDSVWHY